MVKEEIIEGLKIALEKGQSLQSAMMSFFNSGYAREEIEEAARSLQTTTPMPSSMEKTSMPEAPKNFPKLSKFQNLFASKPKQKEEPSQNTPVSVQKISSYGNQQGSFAPMQKPKGRLLVFFLIFLLVFFISLLITIFVFKDDLIGFFASLSG